VTKAIWGLVLIDEPLQLLAGIDTQTGVFVAGFTQIEKNNFKQTLHELVSHRRVECAIVLLRGRPYALLL